MDSSRSWTDENSLLDGGLKSGSMFGRRDDIGDKGGLALSIKVGSKKSL